MMNKETWCGIYDVKNKLKKGTFYKKDKKSSDDWRFFCLI